MHFTQQNQSHVSAQNPKEFEKELMVEHGDSEGYPEHYHQVSLKDY